MANKTEKYRKKRFFGVFLMKPCNLKNFTNNSEKSTDSHSNALQNYPNRVTLLRPVMAPAKPAVFQRIIAPDFSFQIDLTFWGPRDKPDAIILAVIEMTSRKLWAEIIKNKTAEVCLVAFKKILKESSSLFTS